MGDGLDGERAACGLGAPRSTLCRREKAAEPRSRRPKRPFLEGRVERAPSKWRYGFCAARDPPHRIDKPQTVVDAFARRFNRHRPGQALGDRTPAERLRALSLETAASHTM